MTARPIFRHAAVWLHRWFGLIAAPFLILVGLTGSIIAFYGELDRLLNPELLTVRVEARPMLDPYTLRERAEAFEPRATADEVAFEQVPGRAFAAWLTPKVNPQTEEDYDLGYNQLLLHPYTGEKLGSRQFGEMSLERKNALSLVYRLHYSLLLPGEWHETGRLILGIVAMAWTIDCFVGFYLTLPVARRSSSSAPLRQSWLQRWRTAWQIKTTTSRFRVVYDLHRAAGLWTWAALFVFAWSGVAFNLPQVYDPVMSAFVSKTSHAGHTAGGMWLEAPKLGWREAHAAGQDHMKRMLAARGHGVDWELRLRLDRERSVYVYSVKSSADISDNGPGTQILLDANSGVLVGSLGAGTGDEQAREIVDRWLTALHTARVFGFPMKALVALMGFIVAALSLTGFVVYRRKHRTKISIVVRQSSHSSTR